MWPKRVGNSKIKSPVNMPVWASTGPVLVQWWQHRPSTGPILAHYGMFKVMLLQGVLHRKYFASFQLPYKHAITGQYWACTGPMLPASDQYGPGTGTYWHVYRVSTSLLSWDLLTVSGVSFRIIFIPGISSQGPSMFRATIVLTGLCENLEKQYTIKSIFIKD